jgi:integrase
MAKKIRGRNEGSIYQRPDGSWRAQISVHGKRLSCSSKTKNEALKWLQRTQFQLGVSLDASSSNTTLEEFLLDWLESCKLNLRSTTVYQYELTVRNHIIPNIGKVKLRDLNPLQVERLYALLVITKVGTRTVRLVHGVLHSALEKAVRLRLVPSNPASGATLPRLNQREMQILDLEQVSRFLAAAAGSRYEAVYYLAITTGMRQAELFGLKWSDLKWNSGTLYVHRQIKRSPGDEWKFAEPKTRTGRRTLKIGEETLHKLRVHRDRVTILKGQAGPFWQDNDLMFPNTMGNPLDASNLRKDFMKILAEAGLPQMRFHDLRHTAASLMLNHGIPVIVVSRRLGHAKASTTLDIYGHLLTEMQDEAAKLMDELVTPQPIDLASLNSLIKSEEESDKIICTNCTRNKKAHQERAFNSHIWGQR